MALSKYNARTWKNAPDKTTPINATALNNIENGITNVTNTAITLEEQVNALRNVLNYNNAGIHNAIYRGKNLGTSLTSAQSTAIRNGTFDDIFVGDYWVINSTTYYVAHCDYMLRCGDTDLTTHHVVVVPANSLYSAQMNTTNTTDGGYVGSAMYTANLAQALTKIKTDFGEGHILTYKNLLVNATANGAPSNWAWYSRQLDLMNEEMVYGTRAWSQYNQNGYDTGCNKSQLALFQHRHDLITIRGVWYWLRSVRSASNFCYVYYRGSADYAGAGVSGGVRPFFLVY